MQKTEYGNLIQIFILSLNTILDGEFDQDNNLKRAVYKKALRDAYRKTIDYLNESGCLK